MTLLVLRVIHVVHIQPYLYLATYVYMYMYDSTSTGCHTCSTHMTILILTNIIMCTICTYICMTLLVLSHTCSAHMTIHILSNICVHVYVHIYV